MLYPLSYEGLTMRLPSMPASVGPWDRGWLPRSPTVCAAPVPRAVERLYPTASTRGADCTADGVERRVAVPAATQAAVLSGTGSRGHPVERTDHPRHGQREGSVVVVREVVLTGSLCGRAVVRGCRVVQGRRGQGRAVRQGIRWGGSEVIRCR